MAKQMYAEGFRAGKDELKEKMEIIAKAHNDIAELGRTRKGNLERRSERRPRSSEYRIMNVHMKHERQLLR